MSKLFPNQINSSQLYEIMCSVSFRNRNVWKPRFAEMIRREIVMRLVEKKKVEKILQDDKFKQGEQIILHPCVKSIWRKLKISDGMESIDFVCVDNENYIFEYNPEQASELLKNRKKKRNRDSESTGMVTAFELQKQKEDVKRRKKNLEQEKVVSCVYFPINSTTEVLRGNPLVSGLQTDQMMWNMFCLNQNMIALNMHLWQLRKTLFTELANKK